VPEYRLLPPAGPKTVRGRMIPQWTSHDVWPTRGTGADRRGAGAGVTTTMRVRRGQALIEPFAEADERLVGW